MANEAFHRKTLTALAESGQRPTGSFSSGRFFSRLMTLAGIVIVLVFWRQTGGW